MRIFEPAVYIGNPSVVPFKYFQPAEDVRDLRRSMKGFGTNATDLIAIITRRTNEQLQTIQQIYRTTFNRDLYQDVRSETSGNMRTLLCALLVPRLEYYVEQLFAALDGIFVDEKALIEIFCALTPVELSLVRGRYLEKKRRSLELDITTDTRGLFRRLMLSLCCTHRDENVADLVLADEDARRLHKWTQEHRRNTDDDMLFNQILTCRSFAHIRAIDRALRPIGGADLLGMIRRFFSGSLKRAMEAIVMYALDRAGFFAGRLHMSMVGIGTTDSQLMRVLVMRGEIDLADVEVCFDEIYGKSLASFIMGDTSGGYRKTILSLIRYS